MISIFAGTDTYGRVKGVSGTPVVTKFAMFEFLPIYPLKSFYFIQKGPVEFDGIPFIASEQTTAIIGIPLASIDKVSVVMAYLRGIFGAFFTIGFIIPLFSVIIYFSGEHLDKFALNLTHVMLVIFVIGLIGGSLTYIISFTNRRERDIRQHCSEFLGMGIDPARVSSEICETLEKYANNCPSSGDRSRHQWIHQLVLTRVNIARAINVEHMEKITDDLLNKLRRSESLC